MSTKSGKAITSAPRPTAKTVAGDEILQMIDKCIDMAVRARELSYRVHVPESAKAALSSAPSEYENKACSFSTGATDRIERLQMILKDTIESLEDFV